MNSDHDPSLKESSQNPENVGRRVAVSAAWIAGSSILMRMIGLINTLILARILTPDDFGLVAIGIIGTQLIQNISDVGVAQAVIKYQDAGKKEIDTLFTFSFIRGIIVFLIIVSIAPFTDDFYHDARTPAIFNAMAIIAFMQSMINPRFFEFQRDLDFSKDFIVNGLDKFIAVAASVLIAYIYQSYWAIIIGIGTGAFVKLILSYVMRPYRPRFKLTAFKALIGFSGWLTGVSFMAALNNKLDVLILGRFIPAAQNGSFYVGHQLAGLPSNELAHPIAKALYPGLSSFQNEPERMRNTVLQSAEVLGATALPASFGFAFLAPDLVALILGTQWPLAIPLIQLYAPVSGINTIYSGVYGYALAKGMTREVFIREAVYFLIRTPIFIFAAMNYGYMGAVYATAAITIITTILHGVLYAHISKDNFLAPLMRAKRGFLAIIPMAIYFMLLKPNIGFMENFPILVRLIIDSFIGASLFTATMFAQWNFSGKPQGVESLILQNLKSLKKRFSN